uniref:Kelch domain-containing protein 1-like n=1 Tax=Phallusia mammillata TaxID=59560 RepID=A0A6F9DGE0_9ASCI|nr:kelch domain-containing protein 1-like [Phallusia mammillata]
MGNENSTAGQFGKKINNDIVIKWRKVTAECQFGAREGQAVCAHGSKLYAFGGVMFLKDQSGDGGQDVETNDLLVFDSKTKKWQQEKCLGEVPSQRSGSCMTTAGNCLYMFGGLSQLCGWMNDLYKFNLETKHWRKIETSLAPSPRDKVLSVGVGGKVYVFGGFGPAPVEDEASVLEDIDENDEEYEDMEEEELQEMRMQNAANFTWSNELFVFDTAAEKWSLLSPSDAMIPTARAAHSLDYLKSEDDQEFLYVFGGRDSVARQNDLWRFNLSTNTWESCENKGCKPQPRSFHASVMVKNRLIIHGGRGVSNQHFSDFNIYDTSSNEWFQPEAQSDKDVEPPAVGLHSLCVINDEVYLFGGSSDLDPATGTCTKIYNDLYTIETKDILSGGAVKEPESTEAESVPSMLNLKPAANSDSGKNEILSSS